MHRRLFILILLTQIPCLVVAQKRLQALVDYAYFYQKTDTGFVPYFEVFYQPDPKSLHFVQNDETEWIAAMTATRTVSRNGVKLFDKSESFTTTPTTLPYYRELVVPVDIFKMPAKYGFQKISFTLRNIGQSRGTYFEDTLTINKTHNRPAMSSICILDTVVDRPAPDRFLKSNLLAQPLAFAFFDSSRLMLNFCVQTIQTSSYPQPFLLKYFISKRENDGTLPHTVHKDTLTKKEFQFKKINLNHLTSGNYFLVAELYDGEGQLKDKKIKSIQVFNTDPVPVPKASDSIERKPEDDIPIVLDMQETFVKKYGPAQVRAILRMLTLIGTEQERLTINGLLNGGTELYQRYFIYNFWQRKNESDPEKAWEEYASLIKEVNRMFGTAGHPGYETEQARVYISYGPPTNRIRVPSEEGALPYEVWQYNSLANQGTEALFLFYQPNAAFFGMELLHSTAYGEKRNYNWKQILYPQGVPQNNMGKRALQMFGDR